MVGPATIFLFANPALFEKVFAQKIPERQQAFIIPKTLPITAKTTCNS
jgi:hypothetical protein